MSFATLIIIAFTCLVSFRSFNDQALSHKLLHIPKAVNDNKEYYRWLSSGFIHADSMHLLFNMFVFYSFGSFVERFFIAVFGNVLGITTYVLFYLVAIVASSLPSYYKHKDNPYYASLGASGAVAAILFASILIQPLGGITFIFFPFINFPAFVIGILYLAYESYSGKKGGSNINHDAHLYGALFGFFGLMVMQPYLAPEFVAQIMEYTSSFF